MENKANYNCIAPFYDGLCQLVFGQRVKKAQIESLQYIPVNSTVLIVGGGTGWILEEIAHIRPSGLQITYIDSSSKMIQLSKGKSFLPNTVRFMNESIENSNLLGQKYDVVVTPFLFSGFSQLTSQYVFQKLDNSLKCNGVWLNIDFQISTQSKYWQILLLKFMYMIFRLICKIEANKLPSLTKYFSSYLAIKKETSCSNFIKMQVLQKGAIDIGLN